jgi:LEA14-like dessication related protein
MQAIKLIFTLSIMLVVVSACSVIETPELVSFKGYKLTKMEGSSLNFLVNGVISNPNWYPIKVKNSSLDVLVDNKKLGEIQLNIKVKMKGRRENDLSIPLTLELESGAMVKMMGWAIRDSVTIQVKGPVKAGVFCIYKKFPIDVKKSVSTKDGIKNLIKNP